MSARQQDVERWILNRIIKEVHDDSIRLSDTGQRELHFIIRTRIPSSVTSKQLNREEIGTHIERFAREIRENAPKKPNKNRRAVVRKSLIDKLTALFSDIWPFGE
jgi:hypothetical protein